MKEVRGIRQVKPGRWEATINHKLLPGGRVFRTFDNLEQAQAFKAAMLSWLEQGVVPPDVQRVGRHTNPLPPLSPPKAAPTAPRAVLRTPERTTDIRVVIGHYLVADNITIASSDRPVVEFLKRTLTGTVEGVTSIWVDAWVRSMKERRLAPGSIRKQVESLARCIDWWNRRLVAVDPAVVRINPLRQLSRGYSAYKADPTGGEVPRDIERDRRLLPGEYERIEAVLQGAKSADRERPWVEGVDEDMLMLFRLLVGTGLRLREAYTLLVSNLHFEHQTIHVRRSKTGAKRDVPMTPAVERWLWSYVQGKPLNGPVFPFWNGSLDVADLQHVSARLSARFRTLFAHAGCEDLVQHDLRHEATCRWMEMRDENGQWLFRPEEVRKITGHRSEAMFMRYLSLRGSDLAARLRPKPSI